MHNNEVAIGADGQATLGNTIAKSNVRKLRKLLNGKIITGFAGSTADAFTLLDRFDEKLQSYAGNMKRAAIELAKEETRSHADRGEQRRIAYCLWNRRCYRT